VANISKLTNLSIYLKHLIGQKTHSILIHFIDILHFHVLFLFINVLKLISIFDNLPLKRAIFWKIWNFHGQKSFLVIKRQPFNHKRKRKDWDAFHTSSPLKPIQNLPSSRAVLSLGASCFS
jgi:hypothetical protein